MTAPRIAIIGAGIAGLTCGRALARAGLAPVIFDKGRGLGGRLATRRTAQGLQFDHGAGYLVARSDGFRTELADAVAAGALAPWNPPEAGGMATAHVGLPGMSGLARYLGQGLDLRSQTTITAVSDGPKGAVVTPEGGDDMPFDHVVMMLPAPQIARILGADHALASALASVAMAPCLTLMAAFAEPAANAPDILHDADPDAAFARILRDGSKPARNHPLTWVAHAGCALTRRHLDADMATVTPLLLPLLSARIGAGAVLHAQTHRWRHALTAKPLGAPYLAARGGRLWLGGDWCLGPDAEDGWQSGVTLARDLLSAL